MARTIRLTKKSCREEKTIDHDDVLRRPETMKMTDYNYDHDWPLTTNH